MALLNSLLVPSALRKCPTECSVRHFTPESGTFEVLAIWGVFEQWTTAEYASEDAGRQYYTCFKSGTKMVLADKILEGMTDRKIGTASAVEACNALKRDLDIVGKPH